MSKPGEELFCSSVAPAMPAGLLFFGHTGTTHVIILPAEFWQRKEVREN
jgi:hypothetical protein